MVNDIAIMEDVIIYYHFFTLFVVEIAYTKVKM